MWSSTWSCPATRPPTPTAPAAPAASGGERLIGNSMYMWLVLLLFWKQYELLPLLQSPPEGPG